MRRAGCSPDRRRTRRLAPLPRGGSRAVRAIGNRLPEAVARGRHPLTRREREVAVRLARGLTNREIADDLVISAGTAERHVTNILNKLGYRSRAQIAVWAGEHGLLGNEPS